MKTKISRAQLNEGHELALEDGIDYELGDGIARKFAKGNYDVRLRYEEIALQLRTLQPKQYPPPLPEQERQKWNRKIIDSVEALADYLLLTEPDRYKRPPMYRLARICRNVKKRKAVLICIEQRIRKYLMDILQAKTRTSASAGRLPVRILSEKALELLAYEWLRDAKTVRNFLTAIFKHWNVLDDPKSVWRRHLVTHQIAESCNNCPEKIQRHLQTIGILPTVSLGKMHESQLKLIRQDLSRNTRKALAKPRGIRVTN